ncbi:MAG: hypothetical protein WC916_02405 [Candidatus Woesearchaeota archaeon]
MNKMPARNIKLVYIILTVLLISTSGVLALAFDLSPKAVLDTIYPNETASYTLSITNNGLSEERLQIFTINAYWDVSPSLITIKPNKTTTVLLELNPLEDTFIGAQLVPVTLKSLVSEEFVIENFYVYVRNANETRRTYSPNIAVEIQIPTEIDPRKIVPIEIYLRNRNPLNISVLDIAIDSELFHKTYQTNLGPLEEKTNQVIFEIPESQKPGTYNVHISISRDGKSLNEISKDVLIKGYSDVAIEDTTTKTWLTKTEVITLVNHGNYEVTKSVKTQNNLFERIFTKSNVAYTSQKENGIRTIAWTVTLKPNEQVEIVTKTNYAILFIIALIIITGIILYYLLRSPLLIYKRAKIVLETEDGVSEVKVKLHVRNRSSRTIRNIKIIDRYPKIVDLEDEGQLGSLKPTKMVSGDKKHSVLMWNLEILEPYEERLVSYKLCSKLNIIGNVHLPSAKVKFQTRAGERTQLSNNVKLLHRSHQTMDTPMG